MIYKFDKFFENNKDNKYLMYYAFDHDDNLLHMPTVIHMEKMVNGSWEPVDVSTSDFATVRNDSTNYRILDNDPSKAFSEFRDFGSRGDMAFLLDTKNAIQNGKFGPSWVDFIECLTNGSLFALITARGHSSSSIEKAFIWIIDNYLIDSQKYEMYNNLLKYAYLYNDDVVYDKIYKGNKLSDAPLVKLYLSKCDFIGVSNPESKNSALDPEKAKEEALLNFKHKIDRLSSNIGYKAMIGFSDDDIKNVKHIENLMHELDNERFPNIIKMVIKNTNDPKSITKKERNFESHDPLNASVVPFMKFNSISSGLVSNKGDRIKLKHQNDLDAITKLNRMIAYKRKKK